VKEKGGISGNKANKGEGSRNASCSPPQKSKIRKHHHGEGGEKRREMNSGGFKEKKQREIKGVFAIMQGSFAPI